MGIGSSEDEDKGGMRVGRGTQQPLDRMDVFHLCGTNIHSKILLLSSEMPVGGSPEVGELSTCQGPRPLPACCSSLSTHGCCVLRHRASLAKVMWSFLILCRA